MKLVILGLSITSSWGNGHATIYRALVRALVRRGHEVLFLERDQPWYAEHRDLAFLPGCRIALYDGIEQLRQGFGAEIESADAVIVGSYVPDGIALGEWVTRAAGGATAFYDIDTPVTLDALALGECAYLDRELVPAYDAYLSFTGGPTLRGLERQYGAPRAVGFYCCVDPEEYFPEDQATRWALGYLGTYAPDRQPSVERMLLDVARRRTNDAFVIAGPQFPGTERWPGNVRWIAHLPPGEHRAFYAAQRFTLNVTRAAMIERGWSPSVRLFEAAACGVPVISDRWPGMDEFFAPGTEILLADSTDEVNALLGDISPEEARAIGMRARARVCVAHTAAHRARQLEQLFQPAPALAETT